MNKLKGGTLENIDPGIEAIKPLAKGSAVLYTQADQLISLFERGEIAIAPWYPDRAGVAMDKGLSLAVAYPKEGAVGILPAVIIPKGTAKLELAHKFIDQVLSAEGQGCFSERAYIGAVNTKVKLSEKLQKIVPYGETLEKAWFIDPEVVAKNVAELDASLAARGGALSRRPTAQEPSMSALTFERLGKRYGDVACRQRRLPDDQRRASSSRCSAPPAAARPRSCGWSRALSSRAGPHPDRQRRRHRAAAKQARAGPRLPVLRAVPASDRVRERRVRPAPAQGRRRGARQAREGSARDASGSTRFGERYPRQLSGGQQQRVAIARALAPQPRVLLFDEPLSNLDAQLRDEMQIELKRLQRGLGITTLFVTHDQGEALSMSDRVGVMARASCSSSRRRRRSIIAPPPASSPASSASRTDSPARSRTRRRRGGVVRLGDGLELPAASVDQPAGRNASMSSSARKRSGCAAAAREPGARCGHSGAALVRRRARPVCRAACGEVWSSSPRRPRAGRTLRLRRTRRSSLAIDPDSVFAMAPDGAGA